MARSDTIRSEIARLQAKKAAIADDIAKNEKAAGAAREQARKNASRLRERPALVASSPP